MTGGGPPRGSIAETVQTTDGFLRHAGREFLVVLYTAVRSLKLYPLENAQVAWARGMQARLDLRHLRRVALKGHLPRDLPERNTAQPTQHRRRQDRSALPHV